MNADGNLQTRLTYNQAVDSSPTWSADGTRIIFISDRAGAPQLYEMTVDGSQQTRLADIVAADDVPGCISVQGM
jgi:TolB protein